ncbi:MAG: efflux RND transporter periplasmic adaptor subunit [Chitinophagales bacterium]
MNYKIVTILSLFIALTSCKNNSSQGNEAEDTKAASKEKTTTELELTDAQIKAIDLQFGSFEYKNLTTTLKINGKLSLPPQHQAEVSILNGGVVKSIAVEEGQFVNAGKTLATIANAEVIQLQQDYLENSANLTYLEKEYQRQKALRDEDINAGKTYQQAQRELEIAQAKKQTLKSRLAQLGINAANLSPNNIASSIAITAPISGYIQHINLSIGKFADANAILFEIVDNRYLHLDLKVFEKDLHKIKEGQQIIFSDANDVAHSHPATIFAINKAFEPNEQAVLVHAKINETTETLLPGMYVEARVKIDNTKAMALPTDAIVSNGDEHYIFIQTKKNTFKEIRVNIGAADMGYTEVIPIDEVSQSDKIVTKGAYYLLSELTKGSGEEE